MRILKMLAATAALLAPACAIAQSSPNLRQGQVPTPTQWNSYFAAKQDVLGYVPMNSAGGTFSGRIVTAPPASTAGLNLTPGSAPASPVNGDLWVTSSSIFARVNGSTVDLINGACPTCAVTNANNVFTSAVQTVQGLTATQPAWYARLTGDTVARVRVGLNGSDNGSISFGPGNVARDTSLTRTGIASLSLTGSLSISPTAASLNQGISIAQTSPVGGSVAGPVLFNSVSVVDQGITVTGSGEDSFGLANINAIGLRVNYSVSGGPLRGAIAGAVKATADASGASYYGVVGSAYTNIPTGNLWGNIGVASIGASGSANLIIGLEGEAAIRTGGTASYRIGVGANSQGPVAATVLDTAYAVSNGPDALSAPFKKMFAISANLYGQNPLATNADIFFADAPITIANVFNSSNWTVTNSFADFPTFGISGASGKATFGLPLSSIGANYTLEVSGTSKGIVGVGVNTNTTTGASFVELLNSTAGADMALIANEAARTTVRYGLTLGNYAELSAFAGNGLILGVVGNNPLVLGTDNANRMQIAGSGCVSVGNTTDCGSPGIINLLTGLRIGNAAPSGQVIRGNGTNGVFAALACGDLSNSGAGCLAATMTATVGGLVPTPPNNTTTFLRGDSTFAVPSIGSIAGLGTGFTTAAAIAVNAAGGFVTSPIANANLTNSATVVAGQTCTLGSTCGLSAASNVLGSNTALNNTANYFTGPSMAQGTSGTWKATGTVSLSGNAGDIIYCRMIDNGTGTTPISSGQIELAANTRMTMALSGQKASPAGNIRIECRDISSTAGLILFNATGNSTDSSIWGERIN